MGEVRFLVGEHVNGTTKAIPDYYCRCGNGGNTMETRRWADRGFLVGEKEWKNSGKDRAVTPAAAPESRHA
jgi:hypothetical protein